MNFYDRERSFTNKFIPLSAMNIENDIKDFNIALNEHAIVTVTDAKGKILYVNEKFCEISKYSRKELIGKDHRIINSSYHSKEFFQN